ncbi:hypothetical protein GCM10010401_11540 [Rarobacter faecitabidus]|uniref:Multisubunit sodium/proton antiporter MrpE subunit n=1 Tax=Rarobacter faecitabidus TaxID=13243 RepID=A0A542ZP22_RARFA|nr:Na+/H+ antiporter subunit E [Rarobacter faecitabidus]TQL62108.1 multisubunit sodium/proton antiporter MrpE subunit [Rarobacter faecitabidus]
MMTPHRRGGKTSLIGVLVLTLMWALLWGTFAPGTLVAGLLVAIVIVLTLPLTRVGFAGKVRPWYVLVLLVWFHWDLLRASFQVAALAFRRRTPRGAIIGVRLRRANDLTMTAVAQISALLPGTLVVDAHRMTGVLYLHVLDIDVAGGADKVRADVLTLEARVMRAMGSTKDLDEFSLTRSSRASSASGTTGERLP